MATKKKAIPRERKIELKKRETEVELLEQFRKWCDEQSAEFWLVQSPECLVEFFIEDMEVEFWNGIEK